MPTAKARMLELSPLSSGNTARAHFLAITQTGGGTPTLIPTIHELTISTLDDTPLTIISLEDDLVVAAVDTGSDVVKTETDLKIEVTDSEVAIRECE